MALTLDDLSDGNIYLEIKGTLAKRMCRVINENIKSINEQVKTYRDGGIIAAIYQLKDKLTGSQLTKERAKLAGEFQGAIEEFKKEMVKGLSPKQLEIKIAKLEVLISTFEQKNRDLSTRNNKGESSGRLAATMKDFKEQLNVLRGSEQPKEESSMITSMKRIS